MPAADSSQADSIDVVSDHTESDAESHSVEDETNLDHNSETDSRHGGEEPGLSHSHPEDQAARGTVTEVTLRHLGVPRKTVGHIRRRVGQIVKPVNRLIQNMMQRNKQASDVVSGLAKTLFL